MGGGGFAGDAGRGATCCTDGQEYSGVELFQYGGGCCSDRTDALDPDPLGCCDGKLRDEVRDMRSFVTADNAFCSSAGCEPSLSIGPPKHHSPTFISKCCIVRPWSTSPSPVAFRFCP